VTKLLYAIASLLLALTTTVTAGTQDQDKPKAPTAAPKESAASASNTPLKVQVVIGRYQGEKKISSMPYTLTLSTQQPNNHASLRMGAKVPVVTTMMTNVPKDAPALSSFQYQDVGTNIDCGAHALDDGRFLLSITVDDTSVYPDDQSPKGYPSIRSFRASNAMMLKNGETGQFTAATDKVNGEVTRVDVTLTVMK
jgi:type II secretory pathway component GspD/PulD (secretin)